MRKIILGIIVYMIMVCFSNVFVKEIYTIEGEPVNRFKAIFLIAKDCIENETITYATQEFEVDLINIHHGGGRYASDSVEKKYYLNIEDMYVTPMPLTMRNELYNLEQILRTTEFVLYKNSKVIAGIDGVPLTECVNNVESAKTRFEIHMYENGHIDIEQTVILKSLGDVSAQCQVCFEREGIWVSGFGIDSVVNDRRGAMTMSDGTYKVYIQRGTEIVSNVIVFRKENERYQIFSDLADD